MMMNTMIDTNRNYSGAIWSPNEPTKKEPCVLSFNDNEIILKTNINHINFAKIFGFFDDIGYFIFFECYPSLNSPNDQMLLNYKSNYLLYSDCSSMHDVKEIEIKKASIQNETISKWFSTDKNIKGGNSYHEINSNALKTTIKLSSDCTDPYINFYFDDLKSISDVLDVYFNLQGIVFFFSQEFSPFREFKIYLKKKEHEFPFSVFCFNKNQYNVLTYSLVNIKYKYVGEIILGKLLESICDGTENPKISSCFNQLMKNYIGLNAPFDSMLVEGIRTYEKYFNKFLKEDSEDIVLIRKKINGRKSVFQDITGIKEYEKWKDYLEKICITRNYYVHGGKKKNDKKEDIYCAFQKLMSLNFLFCSVVAYSLLEYLIKENENQSDNLFLKRYLIKSRVKFNGISNMRKGILLQINNVKNHDVFLAPGCHEHLNYCFIKKITSKNNHFVITVVPDLNNDEIDKIDFRKDKKTTKDISIMKDEEVYKISPISEPHQKIFWPFKFIK